MQALELVAAVPEGADSVHVEGVLPLAHGGHPLLQPRLVHLLVGLLTVVWLTERQYGDGGLERSQLQDPSYSGGRCTPIPQYRKIRLQESIHLFMRTIVHSYCSTSLPTIPLPFLILQYI